MTRRGLIELGLLLATPGIALAQSVAKPAPHLQHPGDLFGIAVSGVGDVDKDGTPDMLIGDPMDNRFCPSGAGRVWLISGSTGKQLRQWAGDDLNDHFGSTLAGPGDMDGDGVPDILVGASNSKQADRGYVRAYSGKDGKPILTISVPHDEMKIPWHSSSSGPALCAMGDVNRDGNPDFAVGSVHGDGKGLDSGRAIIVSGHDGSILFSFDGDAARDRLGFSVACAGDVNRDGYPDLLASACPELPDHPLPSQSIKPGYARVYSGKHGELLFTVTANGMFSGFGTCVSGIGDLDSDGHDDLLVSQSYESREEDCAVFGFSGRDGSLIRKWTSTAGDDRNHPFGTVIRAIGDCDGDSVSDFVVTSPDAVPSMDPVVLMSGKTTGKIRSFPTWFMDESHFGVSVGVLGDVDRDGVPDFVVGGVSIRTHGDLPGVVRVFSGKTGNKLRQLHRYDLGGGKE
jgi:hypothetical protein